MFWYIGEYIDISKFTNIFAAQTVFNTNFDLLAKVEIIGFSHCISFYYNNEPIGCEIMTAKWPEELTIQPSLDFAIEPETHLKDEGWEVFVTKFSESEVSGALKQKNSLSHKSNHDWTVVNWFVNSDKITFVTLHTQNEKGLNLWTRSEYKVLSKQISSGNQTGKGRIVQL